MSKYDDVKDKVDKYIEQRTPASCCGRAEWGTFLSAAHVAKLAGRALPAEKLTPLSSGGMFVEATAEPFDVDEPPPALANLREALAPVVPR